MCVKLETCLCTCAISLAGNEVTPSLNRKFILLTNQACNTFETGVADPQTLEPGHVDHPLALVFHVLQRETLTKNEEENREANALTLCGGRTPAFRVAVSGKGTIHSFRDHACCDRQDNEDSLPQRTWKSSDRPNLLDINRVLGDKGPGTENTPKDNRAEEESTGERFEREGIGERRLQFEERAHHGTRDALAKQGVGKKNKNKKRENDDNRESRDETTKSEATNKACAQFIATPAFLKLFCRAFLAFSMFVFALSCQFACPAVCFDQDSGHHSPNSICTTFSHHNSCFHHVYRHIHVANQAFDDVVVANREARSLSGSQVLGRVHDFDSLHVLPGEDMPKPSDPKPLESSNFCVYLWRLLRDHLCRHQFQMSDEEYDESLHSAVFARNVTVAAALLHEQTNDNHCLFSE